MCLHDFGPKIWGTNKGLGACHFLQTITFSAVMLGFYFFELSFNV